MNFSKKSQALLRTGVLLLMFMMILMVPAFVMAESSVGGSGSNPGSGQSSVGGTSATSKPVIKSPLKNIGSVGQLVNKFVEILSYLLIIAAVVMIVWTGMKFILARGNPEKLKEEGKRLGAILIGVALVIGARILVGVVINTLEATDTLQPEVTDGAKRALEGR